MKSKKSEFAPTKAESDVSSTRIGIQEPCHELERHTRIHDRRR
jgi:hypothetical protein